MTRFSSLSRWNNMHFQADWTHDDYWKDEIEKGKKDDPTLEWSVLVRVDTGEVVSTWTRAAGFRFADGRGGWWEETRPTTEATGEPAP